MIQAKNVSQTIPVPQAAMLDMPIRLLFLNTRDQCGADVAVHLTLMTNFAADDVAVFVLSNSEAADVEDMRVRFAGMPLRRPVTNAPSAIPKAFSAKSTPNIR